ncbi:DUF1446 domain-containing protein [Spirosoma aureum]|uniref:DUF1446 domain-containing protein n=1 Tax=Spirosoma aureum TaxID=2692134 RepID=A0A6G9AY05_9BACT|nr:acyclic terpene utilization AtuA family protein [Spirosoma aureum]QIP17300.1 DUF1446 domain-containing protein [Spirosoma aureum]
MPDSKAVFRKVAGTSGISSLATAKEQLLYEVIDCPPDVVANFTQHNQTSDSAIVLAYKF